MEVRLMVLACMLYFAATVHGASNASALGNVTREQDNAARDVVRGTTTAVTDPDEVLKNPELVKKYFACLMERGACSETAQHIKRMLPGLISSDCADCSEQLKATVYKVMKFLVEKRPSMWMQLNRKYSKYRRP